MAEASKLKIGELLVREGLLTEEQLDEAIAAQKVRKTYTPLGEVCVELQFFSRMDLVKILRKYQNRIRLGELLTNLGLVTEEQMQEALSQQQRESKKIGEILIERGFITETALISALSLQLGIPKIVPHPDLIDKTLLQGLSPAFLHKNEVLPAFKQGDLLTVISADPLNEEALRDLEKSFRCQIQPAIAAAREIHEAITQCFQQTTIELQGSTRGLQKDLIIGQTNLAQERGDNIVGVVNYIISNAILEGASDIHIEPQEKSLRVRYRIDGLLQHKTDLPMFLAPSLTSRIKVLCGLDIAERRRHQDGRIEARVMNKEVDLRVSTYVTVYGESVVIRVLNRQTTLTDLDALGFSPAHRKRYQNILNYPSGVILVTGPTGSGKTTTLYASLNYLNDLAKKIITVEDPVEYTIDGVMQGKLDPKLDLTYSDFLKSMMRQDPDVLMVGEIRDQQAAEAVIQAALTGHKVFSTFHTDDTVGALLRLMDMGIETFLISSTVVSVVAQRLLRVLCPHCREPTVPSREVLAAFHIHPQGIEKFTFYQPKGCLHCKGTGFKGRSAIHELLVLNDAIRDAILARRPSSEIRLIARSKAGLISMREDGFYKATRGITSLEEVIRVVFHNESDALTPRSAEEIVALCEGKNGMGEVQPDLPKVPERGALEESQTSIFTTTEPSRVLPGEAYRIRFETDTIEAETDRIAELFHAYQRLMEQVNQPLASSLLEDFIDFIIDTVQRLKRSAGVEFVEFCLQVRDGRVVIYVETWLPHEPDPSPPRSSRDGGLRQVNHLK